MTKKTYNPIQINAPSLVWSFLNHKVGSRPTKAELIASTVALVASFTLSMAVFKIIFKL